MKQRQMNSIQQAAFNLLQCDLRYIYLIIIMHREKSSNYSLAMMPYLGLIIDGADSWISAMNRVQPNSIHIRSLTPTEKEFYEASRLSIKLWKKSYQEIYLSLEKLYNESDSYISSQCKPIAKVLQLYDIYGTYLIDGHFSGNTILDALLLPGFKLYDDEYGHMIKSLSEVSGVYISQFCATQEYKIRVDSVSKFKDYGGFVKSPFGNKFSYRFVLFSLMCQINFLVYGLDRLFVEDFPAKLRFGYILYYYLCRILPEVNIQHDSHFLLDKQYVSSEFRNVMTHYKLGVYMRANELIPADPMFGITQKAFGLDFHSLKLLIFKELSELSFQIETYLCI